MFEFDEAELTKDGTKALSDFVEKLRGSIGEPGRISVVGYTCEIGPERHNLGLSQRRALTVKAFLVKELSATVPRPQISADGKGETKPLAETAHCKGLTPYARRKECFKPDRRVVIVWEARDRDRTASAR